jgi:hypothetical protein
MMIPRIKPDPWTKNGLPTTLFICQSHRVSVSTPAPASLGFPRSPRALTYRRAHREQREMKEAQAVRASASASERQRAPATTHNHNHKFHNLPTNGAPQPRNHEPPLPPPPLHAARPSPEGTSCLRDHLGCYLCRMCRMYAQEMSLNRREEAGSCCGNQFVCPIAKSKNN